MVLVRAKIAADVDGEKKILKRDFVVCCYTIVNAVRAADAAMVDLGWQLLQIDEVTICEPQRSTNNETMFIVIPPAVD